jgi:hypothetical protein
MIIAGTQMDAVLACLPLFLRENVKDWLLVNEVCLIIADEKYEVVRFPFSL